MSRSGTAPLDPVDGVTAERPLSVLSIATLFPDAARPLFGGFVNRSLEALSRVPHVRLTVVAPVGVPPWPASLHSRYRALAGLPGREAWGGLDVHRPRFALLPRIGARTNAAAIARAVLPIARGIAEETGGLDVIDAQFFFPDGPAAARVGRALGRPWSIKARGADISHFGQLTASRGQIIDAGRGAGGLLAVSAAMARDMAAIGLPPERITVHPTGIDRTRFRPDAAARERARGALGLTGPVLLCVGALIPRKGQALLIEALAMLPGATLLLAGAGEAEGAYRAQATRLGVADRVRFLGPVGHDRLPDLYRAADVVAMPSLSEGLANAWVEALASGTPLVISDAGGAAELVTSAVAGRIVAAPDAPRIAEAVRAVLATRADPATVAASLDPRFDWDRNGRALASHLARVAGRIG